MEKDLTAKMEQLAHVPALRPDYRITDADGLNEANALLDDLTAKEKQIEKIKDEKYTPARKALDDLRAIFDEPLKRIKAVKDLIRTEAKRYVRVEADKRLAAVRAEQERQQNELAALEEKRRKAEESGRTKTVAKIEAQQVAVAIAPSTVAAPLEKPDGMNRFIKETWKFKYTDKNGEPSDTPDLTLIPVEFHLVDTVRIGKLVRADGANVKINGIYIYKE